MEIRKILFGSILAVLIILVGANTSLAETTNYQSWLDKTNVEPNHDWTVTFNQELDGNTITNENIYVRYKNEIVEGIDLSLGADKKSFTVNAPESGYIKNETYTLYIEKEIKSTAGKELSQPVKMKFTIRNKTNSDNNSVDIPLVPYTDLQGNKADIAVVADWDRAEQMLILVNELRAEVGVAPLKLGTEGLQKAANFRAQDMVINDYFNHTSLKYGSYYRAISMFTQHTGISGENIASGFLDIKSVVSAWENSPGHYSNMIEPDFTYLGVGYAEGEKDEYGPERKWVQLFQ